MKKEPTEKCECVFCKDNRDFSLPKELLNDLYEKKVVVFAGAGISTESRRVFPFTLFEDCADELDVSIDKYTFPKLMTEYANQTNGKIKLIDKIKERFDYIRSFPKLHNMATRFHRELSSIHQIDTIVTTNWDTYFEDETLSIPFVYEKDIAFWGGSGRKVLKLHGSITNYGSIVATEADYEHCLRRLRNGAIGSLLKSILATKTVLFVGYSFSDYDFITIYSYIKKIMGEFKRASYIVTLDTESANKFEAKALIPIFTDATYFLNKLKAHAVEDKKILSDEHIEYGFTMLFGIEKIHLEYHKKIDYLKYPDMIYSAVYQDGMIHAYERLVALYKSGWYHDKCNICNSIAAYRRTRGEKLRKRKYTDVAYIEGYITGLISLIIEEDMRTEISPYYLFGVDSQPRTYKELVNVLESGDSKHRLAHDCARKYLEKYTGGSPDLVVEHTPFLF